MITNTSKSLAIAIVALFCISAAGTLSASDDSSAASTREYNLYVEDVDAAGAVIKSDWILFSAEGNFKSFSENATKAIHAAGFSKLSIVEDIDYGLSIFYDDVGYNACYYASNGAWASVMKAQEDYIPNSIIGLAVNHGYISSAAYSALPATEQAKWQYMGWGDDYDYMKVLDVQPSAAPKAKDYHVYVEVINDSFAVETSKWLNFRGNATPSGFVNAINQALSENELSSFTFSYDGSYISNDYAGSWNNASYYVSGGEWVDVDDTAVQYVESKALAFAANHGYITTAEYENLDESVKGDWKLTSYGGQKLATVAVDGYKEPSSSSDNLTTYIGVGAIGVLVIAAAIFAMVRKSSA